MRGFDDLEDIIGMHIQRAMDGRYKERHGLVTSYDPEKYLAKVMIQPEGVETDWMPIETGHIGNGHGIAIGLQTGDGKETGDQVKVAFHGGDVEAGKIVQRVHSKKDKPPKVQSKEMVFWTTTSQNGQNQSGGGSGQGKQEQQMRLFFRQDGSTSHEILDGEGNVKSSTRWDSKSITHTTGTHTEKASDLISMQSGNGGSGNVETVGKTWLGLTQSGDRSMPKVVGQAGPKARVWGKIA